MGFALGSAKRLADGVCPGRCRPVPEMVGDAPRADSRPLCRHGAGGGAQPLRMHRKSTAKVPHVHGGIQPACPAGSRPASVPGIGANSRAPFGPNGPCGAMRQRLRHGAPHGGGKDESPKRAFVQTRLRCRRGSVTERGTYQAMRDRDALTDRADGRLRCTTAAGEFRGIAIVLHCHGAALLYRCMTEGLPAKIPSAPQILLFSIWNNIAHSIVYFNRHGTTRAVGAGPGQCSIDIHGVTSARALNQKTRGTRNVRGPHTERCVYRAT